MFLTDSSAAIWEKVSSCKFWWDLLELFLKRKMIAETRTVRRMPEMKASDMYSISWLLIQHLTSAALKSSAGVWAVVGTVVVVGQMGSDATGASFEEKVPILSEH